MCKVLCEKVSGGKEIKNYKYKSHLCSNLLYSFSYMILSEVDNISMSGKASNTLTMSLQSEFITETFQMRNQWLREYSAHQVVEL